MRTSDIPLAVQVSWKVLTLGGSAVLAYAAYDTAKTNAAGAGFVAALALGWFLLGLFTQLGDGT